MIIEKSPNHHLIHQLMNFYDIYQKTSLYIYLGIQSECVERNAKEKKSQIKKQRVPIWVFPRQYTASNSIQFEQILQNVVSVSQPRSIQFRVSLSSKSLNSYATSQHA